MSGRAACRRHAIRLDARKLGDVSERKKRIGLGRRRVLPTHAQTTSDEEATLELAEAFCLACLSVEALKFRVHVLMRKRHTCVYERVYL